ncbi:MAG: hypothetical protein K6A30_08455 [Lachnospiraceae bacterium]|nr:hypothetical protein [Lachnospiraceae bacterium]
MSQRPIRLLNHTDVYQEAHSRYLELEEFIKAKEKALDKAPEGKIRAFRHGNTCQFYLRETPGDTNGKYIQKTNQSFIQSHLQKSYDEKVLKLLKKEQETLKKIYVKTNEIPNKIKQLYSDLPKEVKQFVLPVDLEDEEYAEKWLAKEYVKKEISDRVPFFKTEKGERVRSKSELTIANMLARYQVPYKYECPLQLYNGEVIYPDFTVLNMRTREVKYWEHRGMMGDMEYAHHTVRRIKKYNKTGLYLGRQLMITEETLEDPLGTDEIEYMIKEYLL